MTQNDIIKECLQNLMEAAPFSRALGLRIEKVDVPGETLSVLMPMSDMLQRGEGTRQIHGGAIASLIDTAGCFALIMRRMAPVPTVNFRVDYLRPAIGSDVRAHAHVRRAGATFGVVDVGVEDSQGALLAVGRGVFGL